MMPDKVKATWRNGTFVPEAPVDLPEGSHVELTIEEPRVIPPLITDPEERRHNMEALLEKWRKNPWPITRKFTRDELHERR